VDGVFMQCESPTDRVVYFTELIEHKTDENKTGDNNTGPNSKAGGRSVGETVQLDAAEFALFPKIFGDK
jgi:hypothetical protein